MPETYSNGTGFQCAGALMRQRRTMESRPYRNALLRKLSSHIFTIPFWQKRYGSALIFTGKYGISHIF